MRQAQAIAKSLGVGQLPIAEYPGQIATDGPEAFAEKVQNAVLPGVVEGLAAPIEAAVRTGEPGPREIVFKGTLDEVEEFFYDNLWSDGLPVIPPTIERIERFLEFTDRDPEEALGTLLPEKRRVTVWNVAVNGVMAGCRPEYMPLLLAAVECIADPSFRIEDAGSTPGWEPLVIVNGPILKELDFNYETGVMRVGRMANSSIGRFLRLYMRNVAGLRPGLTDKGTIGATFNVALAENEDACSEMGWEPFSVDSRGFRSDENVVTVQSVVSVTGPTYSTGDKALDHLDYLAEFIGQSTSVYWSTRTGLLYGKWFPLFVISPRIANIIAKDGWSKRDVRQYLYDNCRIPASTLEKYAGRAGGSRNGTPWSLREEVQKGNIDKQYWESDDPDRLVRVFMRPEWIEIVVAGDPARNQARGYMNNHEQGAPVSRAVQLPANWNRHGP